MLLRATFAGFGGQGVLMMGYVAALTAMKEDLHVTYMPSYGAEVRGGTANCTIVISSEEIASPIASSPDVVVAMNYPSMVRFQNAVRSGGMLFLNSDLISESPSRNDVDIVRVPANSLAREMGNDRALNMIMLGAVIHKTGALSEERIEEALKEVFAGKSDRILKDNIAALRRGAEYVEGDGRG